MRRPIRLPCGPQQIIEAFLEETAPRFLLRDRDSIYGEEFRSCVARMGIEQVITTARSPWQNPYTERLIGSIRRECLGHLIVFNERQLRRILREYLSYYIMKCGRINRWK